MTTITSPSHIQHISIPTGILIISSTMLIILLVALALMPKTPERANAVMERHQADQWENHVTACYNDPKLEKQVCPVTREAIDTTTRLYLKQIVEGKTTNNGMARQDLIEWLQLQTEYVNKRFATHDTVYQTRLLDPYGAKRIILIMNEKGEVVFDMTKETE